MDSQSDPPKFEQLSGTKRIRQSPPQIEEDNAPTARIFASDLQEALRSEHVVETLGPHESCGIILEFATCSVDVGSVHVLRIPRGSEMSVHATARRIRGDRPAVFCLEFTIPGVDIDLIAAAQLVVAHIYLGRVQLGYSVEVRPATTSDSYISIVVSIPSGTSDGSEVVLRRVSVAGCDVPLGEAPVRVIVGFNHEPAPAGRVNAAAQAGNIPALTQALDDGCSTQETGGVSFVCCTRALPPPPLFACVSWTCTALEVR
jgi:hypothetical protein